MITFAHMHHGARRRKAFLGPLSSILPLAATHHGLGIRPGILMELRGLIHSGGNPVDARGKVGTARTLGAVSVA